MAKRAEKYLYQRRGVWHLRLTVEGRLHRESLRCVDAKTARALRDKFLKDLEASRAFGPRVTWLEAVAAWGQHAEGQLGPRTFQRYLVSLKQCETYLSHLSVSGVDGRAIQTMATERRKLATVATVKRDLTAVSRVLEYAEAMEWREGNPTLSKRRLLKERRDPIALPDMSSIKAIITACSTHLAVLIQAAFLTGCRQNELVTAKWRQFGRTGGGSLEIIGKGNKRRVISLSPEALAIFREAHRLAKNTGPDDPVFQDAAGRPFVFVSSRFNDMRKRAAARDPSFKPFRFHDLRHLFSVEWLRKGGPIYELQKHLGHGSIAVTEMYLEFLTPEEADRAKKARVA